VQRAQKLSADRILDVEEGKDLEFHEVRPASLWPR
jgi:hypothetical protein